MIFLLLNHDRVLKIDPLISICCVGVDFGINKISEHGGHRVKAVHPCDPVVDLFKVLLGTACLFGWDRRRDSPTGFRPQPGAHKASPVSPRATLDFDNPINSPCCSKTL